MASQQEKAQQTADLHVEDSSSVSEGTQGTNQEVRNPNKRKPFPET
jgi:hypothetical protein